MDANYYKGLQGVYFTNVISNVIKIGNLDKNNKIILDFGCGTKVLSKKLPQRKIINYDINPNYTEHEDYKKLYFDIVVFNHVLMYMEKKEIISTFENIKKINKNCEFLISIGKEVLFNKLVALIYNFKTAEDRYKGALTTYDQQVEIIKSSTKILNVKRNIFFLTDIYHSRF